MAPQKLQISHEERYRGLLEGYHALKQSYDVLKEELEAEQQKRLQAELRARDLEKSYPEEGLRFDRLQDDNKKLRAKLKKLEKK